MRIEFTLKSIIFIVIASAIVGFIIANASLMIFSLGTIRVNFAGDLVAALGNVIGGLIGGIVAYIVASYQVQRTLDMEKNKKHEDNSAVLRLISTELRANKKLLDKMKGSYLESDNKTFLPFISSEQWEKCATSIGIEVSDTTLESFMSVYRRLNLMKTEVSTLENKEYNELLEQLDHTIKQAADDLKLIV